MNTGTSIDPDNIPADVLNVIIDRMERDLARLDATAAVVDVQIAGLIWAFGKMFGQGGAN